ncbi:MAG: Ribosomal RNA large subunit methyltransferase I [bacterium ADurb.Bin243]|nr:MAG: Ribosomal RNA large subunit methyltransferase I [bacterium ADurb.Bin243]
MCAGMEVLDLCCYTGGFGISMKKAGAKSVTCVDTDSDAIATARKNAKINGCEVEFLNMNVFEYLRDCLAKGKTYDFIICDPAKLAANKLELPRAYRTYGDLNKLAIQAVKDGGFLFTFSCTGLVSEKIFQSVIFNSAREAGASLKVLSGAGPSPDHPYSSTFPEGKYLKGLLVQVEKSNFIFPKRLEESERA